MPKHAHDNEQLTCILEGALRFWLGAELAALTAILASERTAYITGQSIAVYSGWIRSLY